MTASISTPADVVNLMLAKVGFRGRIGSLYDGSVAAKKVLDAYAQTRDATLRAGKWDFAQRLVAGALSGGAAPFPWTVEYLYPTDCLKLRNLFNAVYSADPNNPMPVLWIIGNDNGLSERVIWANGPGATGATLVYTAQVTNPALWDPLFIETFATELGKTMAGPLGIADAIKVLVEEEKSLVPLAEGTIG